MGRAVLARDIPWLIEHWRAGRLKLAELVSGRYPLEEINAAIAATKAGAARRNVIVFGDAHEARATSRCSSSATRRRGSAGATSSSSSSTTDDGIAGWGEVYAATVGPEAMRAVIADVFARHMAGESPENVELMFRRAYSAGLHPAAGSDGHGRVLRARDRLLGHPRQGAGRPVMRSGAAGCASGCAATPISIRSRGRTRRPSTTTLTPRRPARRAWSRQGFTAVKFDPAGPYTIHGGHQPTLDDLDRSEAFCRRIRAAVGDRADLLFGTHGQFTPAGAIRLARRIAPYDPLWFEEPVPPDLPLDLAQVAAQSPVPIAAGERLTTKAEFATLLRAGGVGIVQPSLGRVGGLLEARKVAVLAEGFGAQVAPHLYAGPIAWAAAIQLALSIPNFLILETIGTGGGFHAELLKRPIALGGRLRPGAGGAGARGRDRRGGRAGASRGPATGCIWR